MGSFLHNGSRVLGKTVDQSCPEPQLLNPSLLSGVAVSTSVKTDVFFSGGSGPGFCSFPSTPLEQPTIRRPGRWRTRPKCGLLEPAQVAGKLDDSLNVMSEPSFQPCSPDDSGQEGRRERVVAAPSSGSCLGPGRRVAGVCLRGRPDGLKLRAARQRAEAGSDRVVSSSCGGGLCVRSSVCAFRVESPSSRVQRVNDALHGNSHNSSARFLHVVHDACEHVIHGANSHNSGGECIARGREVCRGEQTKSQSMRTRSGVRRPLDGTLPVGDELALILRGASEETGVRRPLEGLMPVEEELASDLRGASRWCAC